MAHRRPRRRPSGDHLGGGARRCATPRINDAALKWTLSRLRVEPVTQALAQSAAGLLRAAGVHGHKYAIDAMLCATALAQPGHVTILTSDVKDIAMLTIDHPRVNTEKV